MAFDGSGRLMTRAKLDNWIGLYYTAFGWRMVAIRGLHHLFRSSRARELDGDVKFDFGSLVSGNYTAFFLPNARCWWLATPLHSIRGLVRGGGGKFIVYEISPARARVGNVDWIKISGLPSGSRSAPLVPPPDFTINVAGSGKALLSELKVLTLNMWNGGTRVTSYHDKQVKFLASSGADVVGIQEDQQGRHVPRLADALGWYHWSSGGDVGVLSKYPIVEDYGVISGPARSGGVKIALDGKNQQINFFVAHLGYTPYGPYDTCYDHLPVDKIIQREAQSGRTPQMKATLEGMKSQLDNADEIPVFFVGDFNAPSHLDYVDGLKEKNCGYSNIQWPTSILPKEKGLIDSFRVAHPDPVKEQGITWSPIYIWNGGYRKPEPLDRIDFILHKGKGLKVTDSHTVVVGEPKPEPNHKDNEWFSDHAAVLTTYEL
ncbi:hypothetical protein CEK25_013492 [Fusarium fujikuroi]|nr:hypothetical protein CEK25_013492 [Fusarium fujikuroi]